MKPTFTAPQPDPVTSEDAVVRELCKEQIQLMFKKKNEEEEEEREIRRFNRQSRNRVKAPVGGSSQGPHSQEPKYDEEYYNNLIKEQQNPIIIIL